MVKNTLAKIAAKEAGIEGFDELLTGPTAIAFITGDVVEAAKGLRDFAKANPALVIKGGVLDGKAPRRPRDRPSWPSLESREVLLGKLAGAMLASLSQAVYLLNAPLAQAARLAGALQAKAEQDPSILAGGPVSLRPPRPSPRPPPTRRPPRSRPRRPRRSRPRPTPTRPPRQTTPAPRPETTTTL